MTASKAPPISALRALEPRPGGHWAVFGQEGPALSLSYMMDNGSEAITYTLHQCKTEEEVRKHCASFVYEYTEVYENAYNCPNVDQIPIEIPNIHEATPQLYHTRLERPTGQYPTGQIQQPQEGFLFGNQTTVISPPTSQAQSTSLASQTQVYQQDHGYSISNDQQASPGVFASETVDWPLNNGFFSTDTGNAPISVHNNDTSVSQDTTMLLGGWQQNWLQVNPNGSQGSEGDWNTFFSHH